MTSSELPSTPAGRACTAAALVVLAAGGLAWTWLGQWQWMATGAAAFLLILMALQPLVDSPQARNRAAARWCIQCGRVRQDLERAERGGRP